MLTMSGLKSYTHVPRHARGCLVWEYLSWIIGNYLIVARTAQPTCGPVPEEELMCVSSMYTCGFRA